MVGILRNPVDVLRSFAGLSRVAVEAATGVDMLSADTTTTSGSPTSPWPPLFVKILCDIMVRESLLYGGDSNAGTGSIPKSEKSPWAGRCHYIAFSEFKKDPVQALEPLFAKIQLTMTQQMKDAVKTGLGHHETYKTRHSYQNPTFQDMGIDQDAFLQLPGVIRYTGLLKRPSNAK